ncbi:MAG: tRNA uridine-5-carboxymethylaminomethyl(34) synthesis GTPase MnmE [Rikenellaceae bacterium]
MGGFAAINEDIIVAPATLSGGAIAIVRLSGEGSIELADKMFRPVKEGGARLSEAKGYTLHYGYIVEGDEVIDDVMVSLFRAPHSYTSEDGIEISCHGSSYIVGRIIGRALSLGARMATEGEFTIRAFLAGRIDLSQAEAVSDMIASSNRATHALASTQMRGGYSEMLNGLRAELVRLSALLELELDFSDEDVEFANRGELTELMSRLKDEVERLMESFKVGNAIKEGVAVAIVGAPNAGKSTLLNRLLGEERAMVSEVAGTTRDTIEDVVVIDGVAFRFIDTAGLHKTTDRLEQMGIERTYSAIERARVVIQLIDIDQVEGAEPIEVEPSQKRIVVLNKADRVASTEERSAKLRESGVEHVVISAKEGSGVADLVEKLSNTIDVSSLYEGGVIVSNARHYDHLRNAADSLTRAHQSIKENQPTDLLTEDLRHTLHHIGAITGEITNDEVLGAIFSSFCIGK